MDQPAPRQRRAIQRRVRRALYRKGNTVHRFIIAVLTLLMVTAGCAGPWKGKILDVETKEPLEGTVVLAVWQRVYRTPAGNNAYFYEAKETVTDKAGEFEIPSYTPINLLPLISFMRGPEFTIFKQGYGSLNGLELGGYLTGEISDDQVLEKRGKRYRFTRGVIGLPALKTKDERLKMLPSISDPFIDHYEKKLKYSELLGKESKDLGLEPEGPVGHP
jgi:hypothetical protein